MSVSLCCQWYCEVFHLMWKMGRYLVFHITEFIEKGLKETTFWTQCDVAVVFYSRFIIVFQPTEVVKRKTKKSHSMKSKSTGHLLETSAHSKYLWVPRPVHMSVFLHLRDRLNPEYKSVSVTSVCNLLFTAVKSVGCHCPPDGLLKAVCCLHS